MAPLAAPTVAAQEFYAGALYSFADDATDATSDTSLSGLAGVRFEFGNDFFVAGEAEHQRFDTDGIASRALVHNYRALVGTSFQGMSVYIGASTSSQNTEAANNTLLNLGLDIPINDAFTLRFESLQDLRDDTPLFTDFQETIRVGTIFSF